MNRYAKAIMAVLIPAATAVQAALTDGVITRAEWLTIGMAVLGAFGVWRVPNQPPPGPTAGDGQGV